MLDTPTLQRYSVSFCWSAVVQNRQQIFEFASTGHSTPPTSDRRTETNFGDQPLGSKDREFPNATRGIRGRCRSVGGHHAAAMKIAWAMKNLTPGALRREFSSGYTSFSAFRRLAVRCAT